MQVFSETVSAIYEAAVRPENWPAALEKVGACFDAEGAVIIFYSGNSETDFIHSPGLHDAVKLYQAEDWHRKDLHALRAMELHLTAGDIFDDFSVATREEIGRHPIYTDFFRRVGFGWLMSCVVLPDSDKLVALSVPRASAKGPFSAAEMETLRLIGSHVEQALRISLRIADLDVTTAALHAVLDKIDTGVLLLDAKRRLLFANACGQQSRAALFEAAAGPLVPRTRSERAVFAAMVGAAGGDAGGMEPPRATVLTAADGRRFAARVLPASAAPQWQIGAHDTARTFILTTPLEQNNATDPALVRDLFHLTLGEARLAVLIGSGVEVRGAASRLGIAEGTARIVLKRIFRKLGINRQAELVLKLSRVAGIAPPSPAPAQAVTRNPAADQ